jgi:hypothetical protein
MKLTGKFTQELKDKLLKKVRDDYFNTLVKGNFLVNAILDLIKKGVTPVKNAGNRFQKYSETYRLQIKGKIAFYTGKNGGVIPVTALSVKDLKSYRASKEAKAENTNNKAFILQQTQHLKGKKLSPVNMTVTGAMLKSLTAKISGKFIQLKFSDKLAYIHDTLGAGKSKVKRRLLPHSGEKFTKRINDKLKQSLKDSIAKQAKSKLRLLNIRIKF